jgi:hypothetical protein
MDLPFTQGEFFGVFARYNTAVWPLQTVLFAAAVASFIAVLRGSSLAGRFTYALLAFLWFWMAVVYQWVYFRSINPAAPIFAAVFLVQSGLFLWAAKTPGGLRADLSWRGVAAFSLVVYALFCYPVIGRAVGHVYPAAPTFGLPCPTTLFTIGILLWARPARPVLLVIPILWSIVGLTAAFRLGVREDSALAVSAAAGLLLIGMELQRRRKAAAAAP